jgi:hypothetical protein
MERAGMSALGHKRTWDNDFGFSISGLDCFNVVSRYGSANAFEFKIADRFNCSNGDKARPPDVEHSF